MIITFVADQFDSLNNGTTASARNFVSNLRALGHTVRVLTTGEPGPDKFILPELKIPLVYFFAHRQGIAFAKADEKIIREALDGADVVHFYFPFPLARKVEKMAREMNIPCIAAFHVQPENITYITRTNKIKGTATFFYKFLHFYFFNRFRDIHCPTEFTARELRRTGYKANMHVISNGVEPQFVPAPKKPHENIRILMMGRLSVEKRQAVLIEAIKYSKYKDKIQLVFTGRGPMLDTYKKLGESLPIKPTFGFYSREEQLEIIHSADLYVHASNVELESIACMEAFSCGLVPVISDSKTSATPQFALDERSLFEADNPKNLAEKIDYWLSNPEELQRMSVNYAKLGDSYRVMESAKKMLEVYKNLKPGRI